ncbi:Fe-S cluster assembly protein SufD [Pseudoclavibacter helvolus]|uniref:Fe-S cluster assembly protein SufD n=1 Tax=Pseudoclavibacter helvolus TaxID=255205 RepID=UPI0008391A77|nr:Fe-S cluster assembly protein SufD [Pseudoclavibacter helvolus]
MTTQVTSEQINPLGLNKHSHGPGSEVPVQTRSERFTSFDFADFAPLSGREIEWKYTPVAKLDALINGELVASHSELEFAETDGVTVSWIPRSDARIGSAGKPEDRASANAWTNFEEALLVEVSGEDDKQFVLDRKGFGSKASAAHVVVDIKPHARGLIILRHTGEATVAENVEILVGDGANVTVVSMQEWEDSAQHLSTHFVSVGRDAFIKHIVVSLGGGIVRLNPTLQLNAQGADGELYGLYYSDAGQHLEHQVFVDHNAPHTRSRVNYKGALQGQGARAVWIGDVLIRRNAPGTDSYEQNRNLVLSEGTRADSVPNLEIETGDIEGAGHASATGRFDDEQLFYLMSRGISEAMSRRLVVHGFLNEIVQQIGNEEIATHLRDALERELNEGASPLLVAER